MDGFWKRFRYYLIGLSMGTLLVFSMLGNRKCTWLPQNRVKKTILHKVIVFPDDQQAALDELNINRSNIYNFFIKGTIDFGQSLKKQGHYPKVYIYKPNDTIPKRVQFSIYEDSYLTVVHVLEDDDKPTQYEQLEGFGTIVGLPRDSSLVFIENSNLAQCKAKKLASKDLLEITQDIKKTGRVNFSKSDLMALKATQQIHFTQNDTLEVEATTIWFESRILIKDFIWDEKLPCED